MRDSQHGGRGDRARSGLAGLARTVVARLVARDSAAESVVDQAMVAEISSSLLDPDPVRMDRLRQELRRARISEVDLVDRYFPEVARQFGCAWVDDGAPFTDVTIAVARMQAMLRSVGRDWTSNDLAEQSSATVLIVLPEGEQHSFGPMLLAGQLRRHGISVRLEVGTPLRELRAIVRDRAFDCAMISVSCEEKLDRCREVVNALKRGSDGQLWVAIGGALLARGLDLRGLTAADIATSDPYEALQGAYAEHATVMEVTG